MIPYDLGNKVIAEVFAATQRVSLIERIKVFQEFRDFYENDFEQIKDHLKNYVSDTYSEQTLKKLRFQHRDIVHKILNRKTAGIFEKPSREYIIGKEDSWDELPDLLNEWDWNEAVKEAAKRMLFFNTVLAQPIYRNDKINVELNTGEGTIVIPNSEDYLIPSEVYLNRTDFETGDLYIVYWSEDDHYIIDGHFTDTVKEITGNQIKEYKGEVLENNFGLLPFATLRHREGMDFWGEPNYSLLQDQREYDIDLTNFKRIQEFQGFGVWVATNLNLAEKQVFNPNMVLRRDDLKTDDIVPDLKCIVPQINFDGLRDNMDWGKKTAYESQGLSSASGDTDVNELSGIAKSIDEHEIQEQRNAIKKKLSQFETELFDIAKVVYQTETGKKIPDGKLFVDYGDDKPYETIKDTIERRKHEIELNIQDEIDIVMTKYELSEEDAIKHIEERKERRKKLGLGSQRTNIFEGINGRTQTAQ